MVKGLLTDGLCFNRKLLKHNEKVNPSTPWLEIQGLLRVDPEWRYFTLPSKTRLGAAERVNKNTYKIAFKSPRSPLF
jgi:hypothetical protein